MLITIELKIKLQSSLFNVKFKLGLIDKSLKTPPTEVSTKDYIS